MEQQEEDKHKEGDRLQQDRDQNDILPSSEADVILDVPKLKVEEIDLNVDDLKSKVSLSANIVQFVQIEAGADVHIENAEIQAKGIEAEAQLKVRLERVKEIVKRTLETVDRNPDLLKRLLKPPEEAAGKLTGTDD